MPKFDVFQQHPPIMQKDGDYHIRIEKVGQLEARDGADAIKLAKAWPVFRLARRGTLARAPIVEIES